MADFDFRAAQSVAQALVKALDDSNLKQLPSLIESLSALTNREVELKASIDRLEKRAVDAKTKELEATTAAVEAKRTADTEARKILANCTAACEKAKLQSQRELAVLETQKRTAIDTLKSDIDAQRSILSSLQRATQDAAEAKAAMEAKAAEIKAHMTEFVSAV